MKKLLLSFTTVLICFSCNQNTDSTNAITILPFDNMSLDPIEGVWQQTKSYTIWNGDTVNYQENLNQHKIYIDGYFMWNADPDPDSVEWHGFGTYKYKNDTLIEKYLSMSNHMKLFLGSDKEAMLKVDLDESLEIPDKVTTLYRFKLTGFSTQTPPSHKINSWLPKNYTVPVFFNLFNSSCFFRYAL